MEPRFREFKKSDIPSMVEIVRLTWDLHEYEVTPEQERLLDESYLMSLMVRSVYIRIAEIDGEVAGYIMGGVRGDLVEKASEYQRTMDADMKKMDGSIETRLLMKDMRAIYEADEALLRMCDGYDFDCELVMFIIHPEKKGKGIGHRLLADLLDYLRSRKCRRMFLFTDWFCDVEVYSHMGYVQRASIVIEQGREGKEYPFYIFSTDL